MSQLQANSATEIITRRIGPGTIGTVVTTGVPRTTGTNRATSPSTDILLTTDIGECVNRRSHQERRFFVGRGSVLFVNHFARHAAVDHEISSRNKAGAFAIEKPSDDLGDVRGFADSAGGVLRVVLAAQCGV